MPETAWSSHPVFNGLQRAVRAVRMRTTQPEGAGSAEAMLGRRIGIWWDDDAVFYYGTSERMAGGLCCAAVHAGAPARKKTHPCLYRGEPAGHQPWLPPMLPAPNPRGATSNPL